MTKLLPLALAAALVAGCGGDDEAAAGGNGTDRAFVAEMVPHHESGIAMARVAQERGGSAFVKTLAGDIASAQTAEIETLRAEDAQLADAGVEVGDLGVGDAAMGMAMDTGALETAQPFDPAFLDMMIPHHEGAVVMAQAELRDGEDPELKALAQQIIDTQSEEIAAMEAHRG